MANLLLNLEDYENAARDALTRPVWEYLKHGALDDRTTIANRQAFHDRWLMPRVLVGVAQRDLSCTLLGTQVPYPIIVSPSGVHAMFHPEAEAETVRGATAAGALMTLSSGSSLPLEEVADAGGDEARLWFHLYLPKDLSITESLIERAEAAGYRALVLTVDCPVLRRYEREYRNGLFQDDYSLGNFTDAPSAEGTARDSSGAAEELPSNQSAFYIDPALDWSIVPWVRSRTKLPIIVKGIVRADDARRALDGGADGVWISNHGGRSMDGNIPTLRALPPIARAIGGQATIILDGGVRRGTDVLTALALGANAVAVGRPPLYGLAVEGAEGVRKVLLLLRDELSLAMAFAGCKSIADIDASLVEAF